VRIFCPVIGAQTLLVVPRISEHLQSGAVGAKSVSHNDSRREALSLQQFPQQLERGRSVPPSLNKHIEHFAFTVDRSPHVHAPSCNRDHHLIEMPSIMRYRPRTSEVSRDNRTEFEYPSPDGLVADLKPALCQQILDIAIAQCEA
jgi:hypothetical protein